MKKLILILAAALLLPAMAFATSIDVTGGGDLGIVAAGCRLGGHRVVVALVAGDVTRDIVSAHGQVNDVGTDLRTSGVGIAGGIASGHAWIGHAVAGRAIASGDSTGPGRRGHRRTHANASRSS